MSEREQFEASMIHSGFDESWLAKDKFFEYEVDDMQRRWEGWQAARAIEQTEAVPSDAEMLDWLGQHDGRYYNLDRIASIVGTGFLTASMNDQPQKHATLRAAIDTAIAQQKGASHE